MTVQSMEVSSNMAIDIARSLTPAGLAVASLIGFIAYGVLRLLQVGRRPAGLPPGPPTLPIIGNLHLMPTFKAYKVFAEWGKTYGPIYSLMVGSNPLIMVQSQEIAKELLDKRGSNYSTRPDLYILSELSSRGMRQVAMKYTSTWRQIARINHKLLNARAALAFTPYQTLESRQMLADILDNPVQHQRHIQRYSNSVSCQMVYGFRTTTWSDPRLQSAVSIFQDVCELAITIPARLMDCYPILQKIPKSLLPVCRQAMDLEQRCTEVFVDRWMVAKKKVQDNIATPSFCTTLAQVQKSEGFSDELASYIAGDLIEAASSTSSDTLFGFLMAMVTHPEVQRRAQAQLDAVVGTDRLPTFEDMDRMPYIRGCVKETLRWMPTTALLVPHSPIKDDVYRDMIIPAGAGVVVNVWALNMDPERWRNPRVYDPSRFENENRSEYEVAKAYDPDTLRHNYVFGAGRRLCQGIHYAERSMLLSMACLLWAFDFSTPDPNKIDTEDLRGGLAVQPAPFECHIKPRDERRAEIVRKEWSTMQDKFLDPGTKQWRIIPDSMSSSTYSMD